MLKKYCLTDLKYALFYHKFLTSWFREKMFGELILVLGDSHPLFNHGMIYRVSNDRESLPTLLTKELLTI